MADPKFSETQLDAINGGVDIRHLPDGTTEIADLLEAMRKNPQHWSV